MKKEERSERTVHDFLVEQKRFLLLAGYTNFEEGSVKQKAYMLYKTSLLCFLSYILTMAWTGSYLSYGNNVDMIQGLHMSCLAIVSLLGVLSKLSRDSELREAVAAIRSGVYLYPEEPEDPEHARIKRKTVGQIRGMSEMFGRLVVFVAFTNTAVVPLMQLAMLEGDTSGRILNPYLPQPFYMPFDTRNAFGYVVGYFINVLFMSVLTSLVVCMDAVYLSCILQLKAQFQILNHSLDNIERRALGRIFGNLDSVLEQVAMKEVYSSQKFQEALNQCLRANIIHHQAILRLKSTIEMYTGLIFFIVVGLASCVLASNCLSILENPPPHMIINSVITVSCETLYAFHYCWYGEELTEESSKVFSSLYYTSWYKYDQRFRKLLLVILANTRVPSEMRTMAFGITASLHSFNSVRYQYSKIITTMYQIMNVWRNKK